MSRITLVMLTVPPIWPLSTRLTSWSAGWWCTVCQSKCTSVMCGEGRFAIGFQRAQMLQRQNNLLPWVNLFWVLKWMALTWVVCVTACFQEKRVTRRIARRSPPSHTASTSVLTLSNCPSTSYVRGNDEERPKRGRGEEQRKERIRWVETRGV